MLVTKMQAMSVINVSCNVHIFIVLRGFRWAECINLQEQTNRQRI